MVTFDAGLTLIDLDLDFLSRRLAERGVSLAPEVLGQAAPTAWARYDVLVDAGIGHPWKELMETLLIAAEAPAAAIAPTVEWLWSEQPRANLWRKPIDGMVELARELAGRGVRLAVLSNSEGRLAELLAEIGLADPFEVIVDSGRVGLEKPDRRIFEYTLQALGEARGGPLDPVPSPVHLGDSWPADIEGALGAGWRAVWYGRRAQPVEERSVRCAADPAEARAALVEFGVLPR